MTVNVMKMPSTFVDVDANEMMYDGGIAFLFPLGYYLVQGAILGVTAALSYQRSQLAKKGVDAISQKYFNTTIFNRTNC